MRDSRETVLITGASSGIGLELARLFAAEGCELILVARRTEKLHQLAAELIEQHRITVQVLTADLGVPEAVRQIHDSLRRHDRPVDVLVNNAGFGAAGEFATLSAERQSEMVQVNVMAPTQLARLLLPGMLRRKRGGILNVASIAAFQPGPYMAVYYASKAYLLSWSEALTEETRGQGVTISCLAPGPTRTGFASAADLDSSKLFRMGAMSAAAVARAGHRGFRRGKTLVIPGVLNQLAVFGTRLFPRAWVRKIPGWLNR